MSIPGINSGNSELITQMVKEHSDKMNLKDALEGMEVNKKKSDNKATSSHLGTANGINYQ